MTLNEADTRARLIDPRLKASGWGPEQISREHYYRRDVEFTPGRIVLRGTRARRKPGRKVDYLLRYSGFPIAVIEAKAEEEIAETGFEQGKSYARDMGVPFVYATNGHEIPEYDYFTRQSRPLAHFPAPAELWKRWGDNTGLADVTDPVSVADARGTYDPKVAEMCYRNSSLYPYDNLLDSRELFKNEIIRQGVQLHKQVDILPCTIHKMTWICSDRMSNSPTSYTEHKTETNAFKASMEYKS
jgi:type I restriction enzyme R subunit